MTSSEVIRFISGYARFAGAPVVEKTAVTSIRLIEGGYFVRTNRGAWRARAVVLASGAFKQARGAGCQRGDTGFDSPGHGR